MYLQRWEIFMTYSEIGQIVIGGLIGLSLMGAGVISIIKLLKNGKNNDLLNEAKEQTKILRIIQDKLIGMSYEQNNAIQAVVRVETSLSALHRRIDGLDSSLVR